MSLRARLVAALALLLVIGLGAFGFGTYNVYARARYQQLDSQLRASIGGASGELLGRAGLTGGDHGPPDRGSTDGSGPLGDGSGSPNTAGQGANDGGRPRGGPGIALSYSELRDANGAVVKHIPDDATSASPKLPDHFDTLDRPFTVEAATGSGQWRVIAESVSQPTGYVVAGGVPLGDIGESLRKLVLIETIAGLGLLAALSTGSWLVLRRGLRPLENMAVSARSINAGDLSQRVSPADGRSEVGQLGLALNSMLGEIEVAFREREETESRLRQFLADASHELRTPLTSIRGFAELFRLKAGERVGDERVGDEQVADNVAAHVDGGVIMRRIEEESARMKTLVDDLLLLARLDQRRPVERTAVDLAVLAADACSDAVAADPTRPITLDAPDPVVVDGVEDHLRQAVANLVSNALRHTPAGTPIEVGARRNGATALLTVRDHGHGLDDEALAHAFDRFWRADAARVGTGAGLGLSIVAGIAREHGGAATAANCPDSGAVFSITLPINR